MPPLIPGLPRRFAPRNDRGCKGIGALPSKAIIKKEIDSRLRGNDTRDTE